MEEENEAPGEEEAFQAPMFRSRRNPRRNCRSHGGENRRGGDDANPGDDDDDGDDLGDEPRGEQTTRCQGPEI